jgi:hypothetical protein
MPVLETKDPEKVDWLDSHCALALSDRERAIRESKSPARKSAANVLLNVKSSIHAIMMCCSGVQGRRTRALGLCEPNGDGIYVILLVGGIRLDLASTAAVVDVAMVPLSTENMLNLLPGIQKLQSATPVVEIHTVGHEVAAWKRLLPAFVERCRTWKHNSNCEYDSHARVPISTVTDENPICTCGQGIGFTSPEWDIPEWKGLLPFATRAAVSPIFSVTYIDRVAGAARDLHSSMEEPVTPGVKPISKSTSACWACGGPGKPNLSACSRCKKARYCSVACQNQDWKAHKKDCKSE